jgi:hypothetical protein
MMVLPPPHKRLHSSKKVKICSLVELLGMADVSESMTTMSDVF